jgi:hypothetical protein
MQAVGTDDSTPVPGGRWGRNLLAIVGLPLTALGVAILLLPFFVRMSGIVAAPEQRSSLSASSWW